MKRKPHLRNKSVLPTTGRKRKEKGKTQILNFQAVMVIGPTGKRRMEKWPL